jgi:hypothetical protein
MKHVDNTREAITCAGMKPNYGLNAVMLKNAATCADVVFAAEPLDCDTDSTTYAEGETAVLTPKTLGAVRLSFPPLPGFGTLHTPAAHASGCHRTAEFVCGTILFCLHATLHQTAITVDNQDKVASVLLGLQAGPTAAAPMAAVPVAAAMTGTGESEDVITAAR